MELVLVFQMHFGRFQTCLFGVLFLSHKNIKLNEYVICDLISVPVFKNSELFHTNNGVKKTFKFFVHISLIFDATL